MQGLDVFVSQGREDLVDGVISRLTPAARGWRWAKILVLCLEPVPPRKV